MIQKIEIIDFLKRNNLNIKTIDFISDIILKNYEDKDAVSSEKVKAISNILMIKDIGEEIILKSTNLTELS